MIRSVCFVWVVLAAAPAVHAQDKVWRCGPDGRTYSSQPCPGGREVPVADPRNADQQREAQDLADRESRLSRQLAAERRSAERAARRQRAAGFDHAPGDRLARARAASPKDEASRRKRSKLGRVSSADDAAGADQDDKPFTARAPKKAAR